MKHIIKYIGLLLILHLYSPLSSAKTFNFDGVSLETPDYFTKMSPLEVGFKFPSEEHSPGSVVGNERRTVTIAFSDRAMPHLIDEQNMDAAQEHLYQMIDVLAGVKEWIKHDVQTINQRRWIYLEFVTSAIDTDIHNIMLLTSYQGKAIIFNFNATREEFTENEAILRSAIQSIKVP